MLKYLAVTTFDIMDSGTSPWETFGVLKMNGDHLENNNSLRKPKSKHSTRPLPVQKCKYGPCYHHHAGSCNFNQSRTEALPVGRTRTAVGRGGRGHQDQARRQTGSQPPILLILCHKLHDQEEFWGWFEKSRSPWLPLRYSPDILTKISQF